MKHFTYLMIAGVLLSGCQTYSDGQSVRSKIAQFAINHPVAAQAIGVEQDDSDNITSSTARFAQRSRLNNTANGEGFATQANAFRQTLWQAAITSQFDNLIAEQAANAYLTDTALREGKTDYYSRYQADQAVDRNNGRIGRSIGSGQPSADLKSLAGNVLFYYYKVGLWTAAETQVDGRKVWRIRQEKLSDADYARAMENIAPLNSNGFTSEEQNRFKPDTLKSIKKTVKAISKENG